MELIDKAALVAEIEKRIKEREKEEKKGWAYSRVKIVECEHFLSFINTLEVKEVDLKKEYEKYYEQERYIQTFKLAKHFFELGMSVRNKPQKGE